MKMPERQVDAKVPPGARCDFRAASVFALIREKLPLVAADKWRQANGAPLCPAAVLLALEEERGKVELILTRRAKNLPVHAGQIAFPGGRIEPRDGTPLAAALREAEEEIGLDPAIVEALGYLEPYPTRTGFRIIPVVAKLTALPVYLPNPREVEEVFTVPFAFLMDGANHFRHEKDNRQFYSMPYLRWNIWGVTAGILRNLYERLYV